jgi:hypothetical protein
MISPMVDLHTRLYEGWKWTSNRWQFTQSKFVVSVNNNHFLQMRHNLTYLPLPRMFVVFENFFWIMSSKLRSIFAMPKQPQPFTAVTDSFHPWSLSYLWSLWTTHWTGTLMDRTTVRDSLALTFLMWYGGGHNAVLRNDVHEWSSRLIFN